MHHHRKHANLDLEELHRQFDGVRDLTPEAMSLMADAERLARLRDEFYQIGFVQIKDIVSPDALIKLFEILYPLLSPLATEVSMLHREKSETALSDGHRFRRVDPDSLRDAKLKDDMSLLFQQLGLTNFGAELSLRLAPLISEIVGAVEYKLLYFNFYDEGDYISAHNDHHMGDRVNVQFPMTFAAMGGIRVLSGGLFKMYYDNPGSMNVLGPRVWHDVPPLVRASDVAPERTIISLRFAPDPGDPVS